MSSIFDPGKEDRDRASRKADEGVIKGSSFTGPGGIGGSFDFSDGTGSQSFELGSFQSALEGFQGLTQTGLDRAQGGIPPELAALGGQTIDTLGQNNISQLQNQSDFQGLGGIFQSSLATASADPFELGAEVSGKLRALSERRNQRAVNRMFDRLKSSGTLGASAGIERAGDLERNIFEQGLNFDLAGLSAGQSLQKDAFGRALGASQGREQIGSRQFQESLGIAGFENQAALQQFGVGTSLQDQTLRAQESGANTAFAANQAAAATSQIPLAFAAAAQNATTTASNSLFASAGIDQNNAAMAKSPIMEAIKVGGAIAGGIATGGVSGIAQGAAQATTSA